MSLQALKARNGDSGTETVGIKVPSRSLRAFSARELDWLIPGPMAQAITFRAFGAAKLSFGTLSKLLGYCHSSAKRGLADYFLCKAPILEPFPRPSPKGRGSKSRNHFVPLDPFWTLDIGLWAVLSCSLSLNLCTFPVAV
jgi:hypothetical protein